MAKKPQKMSCRNREESNRVSSNDESSGGVSVSSSTAPETEEEINSHAKRWDQMFSRLLAFKKKYGRLQGSRRVWLCDSMRGGASGRPSFSTLLTSYILSYHSRRPRKCPQQVSR